MKKEKKFIGLLIAGLCLLLLSFAVGCEQPAYNGNDATGYVTAEQSETPGSYENQGPYKTDSYKLGIHSATVYYPTNAGSGLGAMVFCPPFTIQQSGFAAWGPWFASHGIISVLFNTTTTMDFPDQRANEQWAVVQRLRTDPGKVSGMLDPDRIGVMGWSMGGGASWINAGQHSNQVKMAITLAGHNMSAIAPASKGIGITCPMLALNGATDMTILGGMGQSNTAYANAKGPKILCVTSPAGHFNWGTPRGGGREVASLVLAFTKTYLNDDARWKPFIKRPSSAVNWQTDGID
jgi:dienelactone hydrolase